MDYKNRFKDAEWFNYKEPIIVVGAGGTGSNFCYAAASAGIEIHLFDDDTVEAHNLGGQFYNQSQIGQSKVTAVMNNCYAFRGEVINVYDTKYDENSMSTPIMVSCVDSMIARKIMFDNWKKQENRELFLDMRMDAENFQIFAVTKDKTENYIKHLFDDSEVAEPICTLKQTTHVGMICAGMAFTFLTNYISNSRTDVPLRQFPFKFEMIIPAFYAQQQLS